MMCVRGREALEWSWGASGGNGEQRGDEQAGGSGDDKADVGYIRR